MTDQQQGVGERLKQYARHGAGTDAKGLTANRNRALTGLVLALGLLALMAPDILAGTRDGLPRNDKPVPESGKLTDGENTNHGINLTLEGQPTYFFYSSKGLAQDQVWKSLCKNCATTVWVDPEDRHEHRNVFQIAVGGHVVREYAEVKRAWIADNSIAPWMGGAFGLIALFPGWLTLREQGRLSRLQKQ